MHTHQSLLLFVALVSVCDACSCLKNCKNIEIKALSEKTWHVGPSCSAALGLKVSALHQQINRDLKSLQRRIIQMDITSFKEVLFQMMVN